MCCLTKSNLQAMIIICRKNLSTECDNRYSLTGGQKKQWVVNGSK